MMMMKLDEVRSMLASLQSIEVPLNNNNNVGGGSSVDASLLERYRQARDVYLQRRVLHSLFEHVETFQVDERTGKPRFVKPSLSEEGEESDILEEELVVSKLQACVQRIQDRHMELQVQFAAFATKRDELEQMVHEVAATAGDDEDDDDDVVVDPLMMTISTDDGENIIVDEVALQEQEEKLVVLQQRKAALETQIRNVDKENLQVQKSIKSATKDALEKSTGAAAAASSSSSMMEDIFSPETVAQLQEQNIKMEADLYQLEEIHEFYKHLTQIVEELGGIRILSIQQQQQQVVPEGEQGNAKEELSLTVLVYGTHKIQLRLQVDDTRKRTTLGRTSNSENLKVVHATFLSSTMLQSNNKNKSTPAVQLRIPDLMDLVGLAEKLAPGENLRFVVREASARIRTLQARVEELSELQTMVPVTKIYPIQNITSFGGDDQEVICSLEKEQISVLLRMTPDCPLVKGSVYIAQLVGVGGWDNAVVADIEEQVNALEEYRRPVDVIRAVKKEIQRRQEHEGLQLPPTPTLPARRV